jgi:hypothetical protein
MMGVLALETSFGTMKLVVMVLLYLEAKTMI